MRTHPGATFLTHPGLHVDALSARDELPALLNVLPEGALSKREGLIALMAQCGCTHAVFVGDDVTDEDVFVGAPPAWLTVRVGADRDSAARWFVPAQIDVLRLLQALHEQRERRLA